MDRRTTSLSLALGLPALLASASTVRAQQGPPAQPPGQQLQDARRGFALPVTGSATRTAAPGGTGQFEGQLTGLRLSRAGTGRELLLSGTLEGAATVAGQRVPVPATPFENVPVALVGDGAASADSTVAPAVARGVAGGADERVVPIVALLAPATQTAPACGILHLDIQPITLNLLGLEVRLARVTLDVTALPGPGALLGNLLCALVGLLDPSLTLGGVLGGVLDSLLAAINQLLGGLLG